MRKKIERLKLLLDPKEVSIESLMENKINEIIEVVNKGLLTGKYIYAPINIQPQTEEQTKALTPEILQKMFLEKWNGVLPTVISGDNQLIYNLMGK